MTRLCFHGIKKSHFSERETLKYNSVYITGITMNFTLNYKEQYQLSNVAN